MSVRFIIVNNGLKDLRGHYFETAVSIAEAARGRGLQPILATHVKCPGAIIPEGLDFWPLFCVDHWIEEPPCAPPELQEPERREAGSPRATDLQAYLVRRMAEQRSQPLATNAWKTRVKNLCRSSAPSFLMPLLRSLYRRRHLLAGSVRKLLGWIAKDNTPPHAEPIAVLKKALADAGMSAEFDYLQIFRRDLERLLFLTGAGPEDHVFLPTAHGRELAAIMLLVQAVGAKALPVFHLEFRHQVAADPSQARDYYSACHKVLFTWSRTYPSAGKVLLYTDTSQLTADYQRLSGLPFGVLPIPFRARLIRAKTRQPGTPLCIAYLGDARDEKGFHHLAGLVQELCRALPGQVRFLIQDTLNAPTINCKSYRACQQLRDMKPEEVRLVGGGRPLSAEAYFALVSEADVLLCPYDAARYRSCSSGTFTEALAAGIPTVVPAQTWPAEQMPRGAGETFTDSASLLLAVKKICAAYPAYVAAARAFQNAWLERHNPGRLVDTLLQQNRRRQDDATPWARSA